MSSGIRGLGIRGIGGMLKNFRMILGFDGAGDGREG